MNRPFRRTPARGLPVRGVSVLGLTLLGLSAALAGCADTAGPPNGTDPIAAEQSGGSFGYTPPPIPEEVQEPLLELRYEGGLIKNPDPTPFVRVFPGGRVLIHYPAYMKKAGDYELVLNDQEIEELLSSFADRDVLTVENNQLESMAANVRAAQGPADVADDHGVTTVVEIRADSFTPAGETEPTLLEIDRTLAAQGLPSREALEATVDPKFRRLQLFARGVDRLEALAERGDLQAVDPAEADSASRRNP